MLYLLYLLLIGILLIWLIFIMKAGRLSLHTILNVFTLGVTLVDIPEVIFNKVLSWYKFPTHLSADPVLANHIGIMFADGIILPFGAIILMFYIDKYQNSFLAVPAIALFIVLELIFLKFGYMHYNYWNTIVSACFYTMGIGVFAYFSPRYIDYNPPIPYGFRLLCFVYSINAWTTALLNPLFDLYRWKPGIFATIEADRAATELGIGWILAILAALFIPKIPAARRAIAFLGLAFSATCFSWYMHSRGMLAYNDWNDFLVAIRYFVPLGITVWYDRWETNYQNHIKEPFGSA